MPSTQVSTPEVEAEVVGQQDSPVKKIVEEPIISDTGDDVKVEKKDEAESQLVVEKDEADKNGADKKVEETQEDEEEEAKDVEAEVEETEVEESEVENGKRKSLALDEAAEPEVSPKKLKGDVDNESNDESVTTTA